MHERVNTRSPTNKLDDLQQYLMETAHKFLVSGICHLKRGLIMTMNH